MHVFCFLTRYRYSDNTKKNTIRQTLTIPQAMSTQSIDPPTRRGRPSRSNTKSNEKDRKKKSRCRSRSADYLDSVYKMESSSSSSPPPPPIQISTIDPESLWRQLSFETINEWPTQPNNGEEIATRTRRKEQNTATTHKKLQQRPKSKIKDILIFDPSCCCGGGHDTAFRSLRSLMDGREFFNLANSKDSPFLPHPQGHEEDKEVQEEEEEEITVMRMEVPDDYHQHKRISFQDIMNSRDYGLLAPPTIAKKESYQQKTQLLYKHRHQQQRQQEEQRQQLQHMIGGDGTGTKKKNSSIMIILEEPVAVQQQEQQNECKNGIVDSRDCNNDDADARDDGNQVSMAMAGRIPNIPCAIKKNGTTAATTTRTKSPLYRRMIGSRRRAANRKGSPSKK